MKNTRGYDVQRVLGFPEDNDRVDVKIGDIGNVASEDTLGAILQKLVDIITENDEIRAKIVGDVTIESVEVDRVQLVDANGNKLVFTEDGEINFIAADGKIATLGATTDEATAETVIGLLKALKAKDFAEETTLSELSANVGTTSDTDANTTVIGRLQKLIADLSALSATKTLADLEVAIEDVTNLIEDMQYGGLPVSEMRTDVISTSSTAAEAKGGAIAWSGKRIIHILNQGSVNIETLTSDVATYGQIIFPGDVYQDVVDGVIYIKSASAGSARVTEKRYVSS